MPARVGRLSNGVGQRHPVTMWSVSLIAVQMVWMCTLGHQTGAHYSAVEYTRAKAAVRRTAPLALPSDLVNCPIRATCKVSFP